MGLDHLLSAQQAADLLGVQPRTLYKWTYQGRLPVVKIGRLTRFRSSVIEKLIEEGEHPVTRDSSWHDDR
jgi:excisionase family DNA binding protein